MRNCIYRLIGISVPIPTLSLRMIPISTITPYKIDAVSGICPNYLFSLRKNSKLHTSHNNFGDVVKCFSTRNNAKKSSRKVGELRRKRTQKTSKTLLDEYTLIADKSAFSDGLTGLSNGATLNDGFDAKNEVSDGLNGLSNGISLNDGFDAKNSVSGTSRSVVLQACTVTSGLILALGLIIRQVSHIAFTEGLPVIDCSAEVSLNFETWHLELIAGLVILISSCRYLLLQMWPDFAESSEAANQQVLSSLQPFDYVVVAFLPGFSEELLFRGALLPLFGLNWVSALVVAVIFGALHLGSGRKYSFAIWATFVGLAYGYATLLSSSIIVPITSHALNNLIGGILWRYTSSTLKKN